MASDAQANLSAVLDHMWATYLPQMHERVDTLAAAAQAFAAGKLSAKCQEEAQSAAHKLSGVLGTFGLSRGTELARELEVIYTRRNDPNPELASKLASLTAEIRTAIDSRK
jgi:HPt (histidine-containing phosphotransfer) domain-containing protein